jgi:hypothetical protein
MMAHRDRRAKTHVTARLGMGIDATDGFEIRICSEMRTRMHVMRA